MLVEQLDKKIDQFSNLDKAWALIVTDHKHFLQDSGQILVIDAESKVRYRNKLEHFLRENRVQGSIWWIVSLINDLTCYDDFTTRDFLHIPSIGDLSGLYRKYRTASV